MTFDEAAQALDDLAQTFPPEFYAQLNGGVLLLPEEKLDDEFPDGSLLTMGEYCHDQMGRYIKIYYGSMLAVMEEDATADEWRAELRATLAHEFTHHLEGLGGERGLEIEDELFMEHFRNERQSEET